MAKELEPYEELEVKFAQWNELDPSGMVACSSGTAALHLAWEAMEVRGARVYMSDLNMVACPRSVVLAGCIPRFIDCDDRLLLRSDRVSCTSNLLATHIYGRRLNVDRVRDDPDGLIDLSGRVVEDLAEAHGINPHPLTDVACWSFYSNKIVNGAEGGAVWFRDPKHAKLARKLRSLGFTDDHDFTHVPRGHNYRMSNAHARLILPSLAEADANLAKRRQVEVWYDARVPKEWQMPPRDVVWVYDLRIPGMMSEQQGQLVRGLNQRGVAARHCFKPMTTLEEWRGAQPISPNALRLSQEVIYLPAVPYLTEWDVTRIVNDLMEVYEQMK